MEQAEIRDFRFGTIYGVYYLYGYIYNDTTKRQEDGADFVSSTPITHIDLINNICKTQDGAYKLVGSAQ